MSSDASFPLLNDMSVNYLRKDIDGLSHDDLRHFAKSLYKENNILVRQGLGMMNELQKRDERLQEAEKMIARYSCIEDQLASALRSLETSNCTNQVLKETVLQLKKQNEELENQNSLLKLEILELKETLVSMVQKGLWLRFVC